MHKLTAKCCYIWAVTVNLVSVACIPPGFVLSGEIVEGELVKSSNSNLALLVCDACFCLCVLLLLGRAAASPF